MKIHVFLLLLSVTTLGWTNNNVIIINPNDPPQPPQPTGSSQGSTAPTPITLPDPAPATPEQSRIEQPLLPIVPIIITPPEDEYVNLDKLPELVLLPPLSR